MEERYIRYTLAALLLLCGIGFLLFWGSRAPQRRDRGSLAGVVRGLWMRIREAWAARSRTDGLPRPMQAARKRRLDQEIYDSSLLLKNLAIAGRTQAFSADYLYERLWEHSRYLKPIYAQMLSLYRSGHDREAFALMGSDCDTRAGRNFAMVLSKVGALPPDALVEQMEVFQEVMRQQRLTSDMKQVQRCSVVTTLVATTVMFIMLIDFAVVVVLLHTIDLVNGIF